MDRRKFLASAVGTVGVAAITKGASVTPAQKAIPKKAANYLSVEEVVLFHPDGTRTVSPDGTVAHCAIATLRNVYVGKYRFGVPGRVYIGGQLHPGDTWPLPDGVIEVQSGSRAATCESLSSVRAWMGRDFNGEDAYVWVAEVRMDDETFRYLFG
jgi:hypothetical protein